MPSLRRPRLPASTPLFIVETVDDDGEAPEERKEADEDERPLSREQTSRLILDQPEYKLLLSGQPPLRTVSPLVGNFLKNKRNISSASSSERSETYDKEKNPTDRHVRFSEKDGQQSPRQRRFRTVSAPPGWSDSESVISNTSGNLRRKDVSFHYNGLGLGQVYLRMPDIMRDNLSRTLHMSYSTSVLAANPKTLTDDIIKLSLNKGNTRNSLVNKIERRLENLKQRRKEYRNYIEKKGVYLEAFADKIDPFNQLRKKSVTEEETKRFGQVDSEKVMTVAERSMERRDRVTIRTKKMLPSQRVKAKMKAIPQFN